MAPKRKHVAIKRAQKKKQAKAQKKAPKQVPYSEPSQSASSHSPSREEETPSKAIPVKIPEKSQASASQEHTFEVPSSLPPSWFKNFTTLGKWKDGFHSRKICSCEPIAMDLVNSSSLQCFKLFRESSLVHLASLPNFAYPRLTRLFYLNMTLVNSSEGLSIESNVKGIKIKLNNQILAEILGVAPVVHDKSYPSRLSCITAARTQFLLPNTPTSKQLTHSSLDLEPKIIFQFLTRTILPRSNSRELLTDQCLEILYLLFNGYPLDLPSIILTYMSHIYNSSRPAALPYANLLPKIFEYFGVPIATEEVDRLTTPRVGLELFNKIGIFRVSKDTWKFVSDLSDEELAAIPSAFKPKADIPVPASKLQALEFGMEDLRQSMYSLFADIERKLDEISAQLAG